ncbi:SusD-like starch-binding protein associating with outer membrane [Chitinophaga niastensis]|uniref:SusD-like starch-binding protein associating with outer membrane n=1 Tax=Chitinophaga niastensis TaxID=536980 RepID=A0A2P8HJR8_CHINA|nr:RagB/SusD family nutrient uptake outer membrane protein [Chitinophaga niastensis]PSL46462.1 SusD-like starch-binding protein associating with outer membrane [Chitinophaga niastensis]
MNCLKNIFTVAVAGMLLSPFVSCKKLLEQQPINSPYNSVFWQNQRDAEQGIAGNYALLRNALTTNTAFGGYMSNFAYGSLPAYEFSVFNQYDLSFLVNGGNSMATADFLGDYLDPLADWTPYYKIITQSNIILYNVPKIPDNQFTETPTPTRNRFLGEALFLRAYTYFYMTRIWGDVPLINQYDADPAHAKNVPRTNEKMVLDSCVNDLKQAINLLPWTNKKGAEVAVRANKGAAYALLAHIYMWQNFLTKGSNPAYLSNAIAAVDTLESSGQYQLLPATNYPSIFHGKTSEGIFELNMQVSTIEQQTEDGYYYNILQDPLIIKKSGSPAILNTDLMNDIYDDSTDLRLNYFFYGLKETNITKHILCKFAGPNAQNIYYKNPGNNTGAAVDANIILLRYADLILLRAEAYADQGNAGAALSDINKVRRRAGAADTDGNGDVKYEVFRERSRELYGEGQRWYDLVRTGYLKTESGGKFTDTRYNAEGWKWPVARKLFLNNTVLTQNSYWLGKVK